MYKYGKTSIKRLSTCHWKLQMILYEAIKEVDIVIIEGHRTLKKQQEFFRNGNSKCDGIKNLSNHQYFPSRAIDIAEYKKDIKGKIDWNNKEGFIALANIIKRIAKEKGVRIRCGVDFSWFDGPHIELDKMEE